MPDNLPALNGQHAIQASFTVNEIEAIAKKVAVSGLFPGIKTEQQAFTLMLLCQSEGLHPMQAIRRFHIMQGRPVMRADAIQAEYQRQGGVIRDIHADDKGASARFVHPAHAPEPGVEISFGEADAKKAGVFASNANYQKYPSSMYWARVVSMGVRRVLPGIVVGIYTPEEAQDFDAPRPEPKTIEAKLAELPKRKATRREHQPSAAVAAEIKRHQGPSTTPEFMAYLSEIDPNRDNGRIAHMQKWGEDQGYSPKVGKWTDEQSRSGYAEMCRWLSEPKPEEETQETREPGSDDEPVIDVEAGASTSDEFSDDWSPIPSDEVLATA